MPKRKRVPERPGAVVDTDRHKKKKTVRPEKAVSCYEKHVEAIIRALKKSRGFERQRLAKRIAEQQKKKSKQIKGKVPIREKRRPKAGHLSGISSTHTDGIDHRESPDSKIARYEREIDVLRTLDYGVTARVHLSHALLRYRALAEAYGPLTSHLEKASEAQATRKQKASEDDASDGDAADAGTDDENDVLRKQYVRDVHNVSSSLNNRPFVKQIVMRAMKEICGLLGIDIPSRTAELDSENKKSERKEGKTGEGDKDDDAGEDMRDKDIIVSDGEDSNDTGDEKKVGVSPSKEEKKDKQQSKKASSTENGIDDDDDELERVLEQDMAKYDALLGESSSDDDDKDNDKNALRAQFLSILGSKGDSNPKDEEGDEDEEDAEPGIELGNSDSNSDSDSGSGSDLPSDGDSSEDESSDDEALRPPRKRAATAAGKVGKPFAGASHFLPTLMGGYISDGGESGDEDHEAVAERLLGGPRKNRRGQRARQAIWEKKYKQEARHLKEAHLKQQQQLNKRDAKGKGGRDGWDAKRGAVDASDAPRWLRRKMGNFSKVGGDRAGPASSDPAGWSAPPKANPKAKDDSGPLHPSWEAAKKAKEKAQTAAFEGKKIVFE